MKQKDDSLEMIDENDQILWKTQMTKVNSRTRETSSRWLQGCSWLQFTSQKDQQATILTRDTVIKIPEPGDDAETPTRQQDWERPSKDKSSCFTLTVPPLPQIVTAPHLESLPGSTVSPVDGHLTCPSQ